MLGKTIKHYQIEAELGRGGMGVVYRAQDTKLRRPVALKVLSAELTADADRRRRFLQEARSAAALSHPAIAQIYDVDEDDGVTFIAMELVEGSTVRQLVKNQDLDLLGAIDIGIQVASGLAKAHESGIVHRDIKSENVILTPDGHAKLLDFGLAKLLDPLAADGPPDASEMPTLAHTQVGVVMGTVAYMSPEQARGRQVDHRSDIFSLGVMLYEMASGKLPFEGGSPLDTMHAIAFEETRPLNSIKQNLPFDLQRIVSRCLRKRPEDRYPDARSLAEDLKVLRRDTESGKIRALTVGDRIRDSLDSLRHLNARELAGYAAAVAVAGLVFYLLLSDVDLGGLIILTVAGLLIFRWVRNRPEKMRKRFVEKTAKIPEVLLIQVRDGQATVYVDRPVSQLYQRINNLLHTSNKKLFYGEPMTLAIRADLTPADLPRLLSEPGVMHVREDVAAAALGGQAPAAGLARHS